MQRTAACSRDLGAEVVYVREPAQLGDLDGVIMPGGESTTMLKLLDEEKLFEPLVEFAARPPDVRHLRRNDSDGHAKSASRTSAR